MTSPQPLLPEEDLSWLRQLQKNSWEPEVIISGITLAIIFAFPAELYGFAIMLVQDYAIEFTGAWVVLLYLSLVINLFKIFFSVHLILRFAWAGLLGLSYAFPDGVINANLFKFGQDTLYKKPNQLVLKLERICSMTFGIPLMFGMIMVIFTIYLGILLFVYHIFNLPFYLIYIFFLISIFGFSIFNIVGKKSAFKSWISNSFYSNINAIYQSNLGKWPVTVYTVCILLMSMPFVAIDTKGFFEYLNATEEGSGEWVNSIHYFENQRDPERRFPRTSIPSDLVEGNYLPLSIAYYLEDRKRLPQLQQLYAISKDTLQWSDIREETDQFRIFVNDSLIQISPQNWRKVQLGTSGQKAFQCLLDLQQLPPGIHHGRVEKLVAVDIFGYTQTKIRHRKNWARFSFMKT